MAVRFNTWDNNKIMLECPNIAKWNPNLAINWMLEIAPNMLTQLQKKNWNKAAEKINFNIDFCEKYGKIKYDEYWGDKQAKSRRLELIE